MEAESVPSVAAVVVVSTVAVAASAAVAASDPEHFAPVLVWLVEKWSVVVEG